ncbi:856_t:CDS:2, partial [Gigaspora margarita]
APVTENPYLEMNGTWKDCRNTIPGDYGARVMSTLRLPSGVLYR